MKRVLILGGGFGGVSTALTLRDLLPAEDEILLVDKREHFMVGFRKTWALLDVAPLAEGQRPLKALEKRGITVWHKTIDSIDPATRSAVINGERIEADVLVVALGVRPAPEKVVGFSEHVLNAYTLDGMAEVQQKLNAFRGGRVVVGIFGSPYPCPPGPFEVAFLTREYYKARDHHPAMAVFTPNPMALGGPGKASSARLENRLEDFGISFLPNRIVTSVEQGLIHFNGADSLPFDLALGVPPYVVVDVVQASGLTATNGWVMVNKNTLETDFDSVYAIGDCTQIVLANGKQLPKAGLMAENEGKVVAQRIAAIFAGHEPTALFDGSGGCNIEVGDGQGATIEGHFFAEPAPQVTFSEMTAENYAGKHAFEKERLTNWFGA